MPTPDRHDGLFVVISGCGAKAGRADYQEMVPQSLPFAWFEKIALILLAADLEARGWPVVRLSVVPATLSADGLVGGTDWARAHVRLDVGAHFLPALVWAARIFH